MTRKIGNTIIIEREPDGICELCGKKDELRPYGPRGESICFDCGMENRETTHAAFMAFLHGPGERAQ